MATDVMPAKARRVATREEESPPPRAQVRRELHGVLAAALTLLLALSLATFAVVDGVPVNWIGPVGAFTADALYFTFGLGAWGIVVLGLWATRAVALGQPLFDRVGVPAGSALLLLAVATLLGVVAADLVVFEHAAGGLIGRFLADVLAALFGKIGATILTLTGIVCAVSLVGELSWATMGEVVRDRVSAPWRRRRALERLEASEDRARERADTGVSRAQRRSRKVVRIAADEGDTPGAEETSGTLEVGTVDIVAVSREESSEGRPGFLARMRGAFSRRSLPEETALEESNTDGAPSGGPALGDDEPAWVRSASAEAATPPPPPTRPASERDPSPVVAAPVSALETSAAPEQASDAWFLDAQAEPAPAGADKGDRLDGPKAGGASSLADRLRRLSTAGGLRAVVAPHSEESGDAPVPPVSAAPSAGTPAVRTDEVAPAAALDPETVEDPDAGVRGEAAVDALPAAGDFPRSGSTEGGSGTSFGPMIIESEALRQRKAAAELERVQRRQAFVGDRPWNFPPLSFLAYDESPRATIDHDALKEQAAQLTEVLGEFKVNGTVTNIVPGPVVTMFEFAPESGIRVSRISGLRDDIAMKLCAQHVRVLAPIPGKDCVGIEVPNPTREVVYLKEILADDRFTRAKGPLTVGLGKDIEGNPVVEDLARMPHLLVAGTTGSGKSVAVNAMITSILYNASPDDVRMIMIDPKQLELAIYEDVPHLLLPVVTDPAKAATALQWAVMEMERRYTLLKEMKARNIAGYNERFRTVVARAGVFDPEADDLTEDQELLAVTEPDGRPRHSHLPMILVVIDEWADLVMVAGKDVEQSVARLAQKARAAGIHVILATQRPSTDVLTGLIKANFPTRMSFRLITGVDSRTVLDTQGAEALLGMGDMLYRPPNRSELVRVHGAYVDEAEIEKVVGFLKAQRRAEYDESILQPQGVDADYEDDEPVDDLYDAAVAVVIDKGFASISMVQRELKIGYNRAARMVEVMERQGLVGPATGGSSRRDVLVGGAG